MKVSQNISPKRHIGEYPWFIVAGILLVSIFMGLTLGYLYDNIVLGMLLATSGLIIIALIVLPQIVTNILLSVYVLLFVASYDFIGYDPLLLDPIKIYYADGILLFMVVFVVQILFHHISISYLRSPITLFLIGNLVYGFAAVIIGYSAGNSTNNILGDFRRFFLYPMVAFIPLMITVKWENLVKLFKWFCLCIVLISIIAFSRVILNTSWDPEQFSATNQFRAIGYFSGILICIGIGILYSIFLNNKHQYRIIPLLFLIILEIVIFTSGYRMLWILGVFIPFFITYFSSRGLSKIIRILGISLIVLFFIVVAMYLIKTISPDVFNRLADRFILTLEDLDIRNNIRFFAWTSAWSMFKTSPVFGVGIGDQFEFLARNSGGQYYISHLTTHNILVSLLYQTGIIGSGLFLAIHGSFSFFIWKNIYTLKPSARKIMLGLLAGYFSALIMGMVQPSFESPGAIVLFYFFVGAILNIYRVFEGDTHG